MHFKYIYIYIYTTLVEINVQEMPYNEQKKTLKTHKHVTEYFKEILNVLIV